MIERLHVKNMALIDEAEVEFGEGLNILSGETGAGKSILLGSLSVALGTGNFKDYVPEGTDYALVELVFRSDSPKVREKLEEMDIIPEEDTIILSRRYRGGRAVSRVNGETVPVSFVRDLAGELLDIHGQHEHQKLLYPKNHLGILDEYAGEQLAPLLKECQSSFREWNETKKNLTQALSEETGRTKEIDFLQFELSEIEAAALVPGEDEELEKQYRRMANGQKIMESVAEAASLLGCGSDGGASDAVSHALRALGSVSALDEELGDLYAALEETESLLSDFNRSLADYMDSFSFDEQEMHRVEERLDLLNRLKAKYGRTIDDVLAYREEKQKRLELLEHYEEYLDQLRTKEQQLAQKLSSVCGQITQIRTRLSESLGVKIRQALTDLNFLDVQFEIRCERTEQVTDHGMDQVTFLISTNPGLPVRPLGEVASGGELSRIMLAIKAVMADQDEVETLIFDEIDTGISGRTAQKVSEKMAVIARHHQIICITHLAQIAAMADSHFLIEKHRAGTRTTTQIRPLDEESSQEELARILGGVEITQAVKDSAREMRNLAKRLKNSLQAK